MTSYCVQQQPPDDVQLLFRKTDPGWVVGVGVENGPDVAFFKIGAQFVLQEVSPEIVDVEAFKGQADHFGLDFIDRKAGIDK